MIQTTTSDDIRYARQLSLPEIGEAGQQRLAAGSALVVGAGGLGSPAALYLVAAGVGRVGLMDADTVELSNLQRQILHATPDLGRPKTASGADSLRALNPGVRVVPHPERLTAANGPAQIAGYDVVVDATDNFESKFLIADLCHAAGKPAVHAGIARFLGQALTVIPGRTACYRCVFETPPAAQPGPPHGPLGAVPGVIGSIQATEVIKILLGAGALLTDRLFVYDAWAQTARCVRVSRRRNCALCGSGKGE